MRKKHVLQTMLITTHDEDLLDLIRFLRLAERAVGLPKLAASILVSAEYLHGSSSLRARLEKEEEETLVVVEEEPSPDEPGEKGETTEEP